jgi:predicted glycoside hydrolase/deacetylase ChbG (UPF0249 family)
MVGRPAAVEAAAYIHNHPALDVGLHVELRRWRVRKRPWSDVRSAEKLHAVVAGDVAAQLDRFRQLVGRDPTHLDSHQHRHRIDSLRPIFQAFARELDIPLRHFAPEIQFCGEFYGHDGQGRPQAEAISPEALVRLLERLSTGVTELCSHPGYTEGLDAWYREQRVQEVRTLCDPRVRTAVERLGIRLTSFREVAAQRESQVDQL